MKKIKLITLLIPIILLMPSPAKAEWWNPLTAFGSGLEAIGNFFHGIYMFFYNTGFVIMGTILFVAFFAIEIFLIYIYWRIGAWVYNTLVPAIQKIAQYLEKIAE